MNNNRILSVAAGILLCLTTTAYGSDIINCWFPPDWKSKGDQAKTIAETLTQKTGITIKPRIARSYPEILKAFSSGEKALVYVGSFVQAIIYARKLGVPLAQNIDGKDLYSGIMIYLKGQDPAGILKNYPEQIAFTVGASSGESSAKAATRGKAAIGVPNHTAAARAVTVGKAMGAVVKNWWWESNKDKFPMLAVYKIPDVSIEKNPDNVLTASSSIAPETIAKIKEAAINSKEAFNAPEMAPFEKNRITFSIELMKKGNIDPLTYQWK